ncbi:cytosine/adenosine deaminase-related metal-dependent hydrolase [Halohasta litchfieldiae]|jgi:cytosine/adenosine deaminase-related metal-dependent hydrolase|uniref:Guanine deaminase n=1 Tax=Halohasta litchfieldiae TaxID=1073996 RepID=A0A1H6S5G2_9EURY|nr:5'-deoxyadenosine deaminase [Halohasta litchfieldiae]ATW89355.1 cytosine/adenosine deaminase-related metal-dependent hydrolase [Halohasta litchfieldiae]SEI60027.1 guanine deaminase [Halohasta litchfieldiae]
MLLSGTVVVDETTVIEDGAVVTVGDKIEAVGPALDLVDQYPDHHRRAFDIISPGFVQTHVHSVQSPGRGLADDTDLFEWLEDHILPIEAELTADELELASTLSYVELLGHGTTCCVDHLTVDHAERAFEAAGNTGIRGVLGKVLMDRNAPDGLCEETATGLSTTRSLIDRYHRSHDDRIRYAVTPRFTPTCSEACLRGAREIADDYEGVRIHTHASEHQSVIDDVTAERGMGDIEWLHEVGLTGEDVVLAHVILTNEHEREILAETGTHVTYCPSSNMKVGAGIAPIVDYIDRGINVALGNDGAPANNTLDPIAEMRQATLLQKVAHEDPRTLPAEMVFRMATRNGARAAGFEQVGALYEGWKADVVGIRTDTSRGVPLHDVYSYLVYAATGDDVEFSMVDGQVIVEDGSVTTVSEADVYRRARAAFEERSWGD